MISIVEPSRENLARFRPFPAELWCFEAFWNLKYCFFRAVVKQFLFVSGQCVKEQHRKLVRKFHENRTNIQEVRRKIKNIFRSLRY